jgi:hypothetical protein
MGGDGVLVKITDISGWTDPRTGGVTYQYLTPDEYDDLINLQADYTHIRRDFKIEELGELIIPAHQGYNLLSVQSLIQKEDNINDK